MNPRFISNLKWPVHEMQVPPVSPVSAQTVRTTIYLVMKNSDMTEGRGPVVVDKVFLHREHAVEYMDKQPGVMGRREQWSSRQWPGDWAIIEKVLYEKPFGVEDAQEELRQKALEKVKLSLTQDELQALGLL